VKIKKKEKNETPTKKDVEVMRGMRKDKMPQGKSAVTAREAEQQAAAKWKIKRLSKHGPKGPMH
jgi:hypothetical protein